VVIWRVVPWSSLIALGLIVADRWQLATTWIGSKSTASGDSGA
jgi:hypothetical protein